ncbi:MAG: hypothetical protein IPK19_39625 [Chloroflexi bacterium]|nr:hypothetical protein [Chloroflexota bacterium]
MKKAAPLFLITCLYLLIAVVITYPVIAQLDSRLIGHHLSDAYEYIGVTWSIKTALTAGANPLFVPQMLYPEGIPAALALSLLLEWMPPLLLSYVMSLAAAFNVSTLLTLALNGLAMFVLARKLMGGRPGHWPAAFLAGLVWMTYPAFQGQMGAAHTGLLALWGGPLFAGVALDLPDRSLTDRRAWPKILLAAVLFTLGLLGNPTLLLYIMTPIAAFLLARTLWRRERFLPLIAAVVLGGLLWLPLALPSLVSRADADTLVLDIGGDVRYSAPIVSIVAPSFYHPLFGDLEYPRRAIGAEPFEQTGYLGIVAGLIVLWALICRPAARPWLMLAVVAWVFSLGPLLKVEDRPLLVEIENGAQTIATPISLPWALFGDLPGLSFFRTPARFNFAVGFAVAVMVGFGTAALLPSTRRGWALALPVAALILFDYQLWWPMPTNTATVPEPIRALGEDPEIRAVFNVPATHPLIVKEAMFLLTQHGKPILTGQIARETPLKVSKSAILETTLDPGLLDAAGVDVIIVHRYLEVPDGLETRLFNLAGDPIYQDERFAVYRLPEYDGPPPGFTALTPTDGVQVTDAAPIHFYAPDAGRATLRGLVTAEGRVVTASLDEGTPLVGWTVVGMSTIEHTFDFEAGYHTLDLILDPPCTRVLSPALTCDGMTVEWTTLETAP